VKAGTKPKIFNMKKIININLSGRVIPIEDSAYENLQAYIESLRRYFINEEGRDEIINDIEGRIAELMSEKVRKGASSITDADVDEIAASMGRPQDFEAEAAEEKNSSAGTSSTAQSTAGPQTSQAHSKSSGKGRLYRDTSDKFIGGVCSGLANYMNVDPAIVRILFAIVTFGGFGLGFALYILLWIILPAKDLEGYGGKRLFRNPENKVIGGVASGLGAYFNRDAKTIRLIFAAPVIINILLGLLNWPFGENAFWVPNIVFGSLTGTFIIAYIILWAVLPEARSPYEKMEMRGEKVDVNAIKQNVQEGMDNMKDRMKTWSGEVKEAAQNIGNKAKEFSNTRGKAFASEVREAARPVRSGLGHAIGVLFKAFFLFIAGSIAFALFVSLMAIIFGGVAWWPVNNFLWTSNWQQVYAWGTLILFLGVPLVGFLIWIIRRIIGVKSRRSYLGWTFGGLWTLGWVSATLLASSISRDFRDNGVSSFDVPMNTQPARGRMIVAVSEPALAFTDRFWWMDSDWDGWNISSDTLRLSLVKFTFDKSSDNNYQVTINKVSEGRTTAEATNRAEKIRYNASFKDSILDLGSGYAVDRESKYRGQRVEIKILVPVGRRIRFDETVKYKLNPVNIRVRRGRAWRNDEVDFEFNNHNSFPYKANTDYVMSDDGSLKNADGTPVIDYNYRYNNAEDSISPEEEEKILREKLKKIEDQKKKKPDSTKKTAQSESSDEDKTESSSSGKSFPLLSLERIFN
jgi:phage shock protein PspC (stress-responsive transcriptional regulator)